jgi:hypothetical protein
MNATKKTEKTQEILELLKSIFNEYLIKVETVKGSDSLNPSVVEFVAHRPSQYSVDVNDACKVVFHKELRYVFAINTSLPERSMPTIISKIAKPVVKKLSEDT